MYHHEFPPLIVWNRLFVHCNNISPQFKNDTCITSTEKPPTSTENPPASTKKPPPIMEKPATSTEKLHSSCKQLQQYLTIKLFIFLRMLIKLDLAFNLCVSIKREFDKNSGAVLKGNQSLPILSNFLIVLLP